MHACAGTKITQSKSLRYCPPEAIGAEFQGHTTVPSDPAADIWAFGAITFELAYGRGLFNGFRREEDVRATLGGYAPFPWEAAVGVNKPGSFSKSRGLKHILRWCLHRDPSQRPTAHALVADVSMRMRDAENASSSQFKNGRKK